jgi:hypothetical protein
MTENTPRPDRYHSFRGIDCAGGSRQVLAALTRHIADPARAGPFWEAFKVKLAAAGDGSGDHPDELRLVCSSITYIEELFEREDDAAGLELLHRLEEDCC